MQCMTFIAAGVIHMITSHAAQLANELACSGRWGSKAFTKANRAAQVAQVLWAQGVFWLVCSYRFLLQEARQCTGALVTM